MRLIVHATMEDAVQDDVSAYRMERRLLQAWEGDRRQPAPARWRRFGVATAFAAGLCLFVGVALLGEQRTKRGVFAWRPPVSMEPIELAPFEHCEVQRGLLEGLLSMEPEAFGLWASRAAPALSFERTPPAAPHRPPASSRPATPKQGETTVVRIGPRDAYLDQMQAAHLAFAAGQAAEATAASLAALEIAGDDRVRSFAAIELGCEASIAASDFQTAVRLCARILEHDNPERVRTAHFVLGNLHRLHLGDCREAITHYTKAILQGADSLFTHEARRFRAECAIEVEDVGLADLDLDILEARPGLLSRSGELEQLRARWRRLSRQAAVSSTTASAR